jgi:hypothetical protein
VFIKRGKKPRFKLVHPQSQSHTLQTVYFCTWLSNELRLLSTELRLSTPGSWTLVSQPSPLQKSKSEWASLEGASSSTLPTPSTFSRLERVWNEKENLVIIKWKGSFSQIQKPTFLPPLSNQSVEHPK